MMLKRPHKKDAEEVYLSVSTGTFIRVALLTFATIVLIGAVRQAAHSILILFLAFFLALALNAPVSWISRHLPGKMRGSRTLSTTLSYLVVLVLLGGFIASIVPPLVKQTQSFAKAAPGLIKDFKSQDSSTGKFIRKYNLEDKINDAGNQLSSRIKRAGGSAFSTVQQVGNSIFALLTILVLTFMMLTEGPGWVAYGRKLVPEHHRDMADRVANDMYRVVKGYINGQVILAAIASGFISIGVLILGISYPIALIVIIFICGLIPMVGHTIGAVIVSVVALFHSTSAAIIILIYYILYQQVENIFIQPRIQANSTNMSPLLVFASVIVGVSFGGLFGGLLAIPVAGCIRIIVLEYLRSRGYISTPSFDQATNIGK